MTSFTVTTTTHTLGIKQMSLIGHTDVMVLIKSIRFTLMSVKMLDQMQVQTCIYLFEYIHSVYL